MHHASVLIENAEVYGTYTQMFRNIFCRFQSLEGKFNVLQDANYIFTQANLLVIMQLQEEWQGVKEKVRSGKKKKR